MTRSRDVADTQDNNGGAVPPFAAGKNKIINGDFGINQRVFTTASGNVGYGLFDRFRGAASGGTVTWTNSTFTPGTAPVVGYESKSFLTVQTASQSAASDSTSFEQRIESARTFAGQIATLSFWAKAASGTPKVAWEIIQNFGSGGSPSSQVLTAVGFVTLSTSWARYSITYTIPSVSGKTFGTNNDDYLRIQLFTSAGSDLNARASSIGIQNNTIDFWGVQLEAGSTATAFQTATGTLAGELAACQRYYQRINSTNTYGRYGTGMATGTTNVQCAFPLKQTMRTSVSSIDSSGNTTFVMNDGVSNTATTSLTLDSMQNPDVCLVIFTVASGLTQYRPYHIAANNTATGYLGFSAEL